jgi:hypothetical protein
MLRYVAIMKVVENPLVDLAATRGILIGMLTRMAVGLTYEPLRYTSHGLGFIAARCLYIEGCRSSVGSVEEGTAYFCVWVTKCHLLHLCFPNRVWAHG